jgi:hypothetical protein
MCYITSLLEGYVMSVLNLAIRAIMQNTLMQALFELTVNILT